MTFPPDSTRATKWYRIYDELRLQITSGQLSPGTMIPAEPDLMQRYDVSRYTVRRAMDQLRREGLITVDQGRGTFVKNRERMDYEPQRESRMPKSNERDRFSQQIVEEGRVPSQTISVRVIPAPADVAEKLEVPVGTLVAARERVRYINGVPTNTNDSHFVLEHVRDSEIINPVDIPRGTNKVLEDLGLAQREVEDIFISREATLEESRRLDIDLGAAVIVHTVTGYTADGQAVRHTVNVLPADRHRIRYIRTWDE